MPQTQIPFHTSAQRGTRSPSPENGCIRCARYFYKSYQVLAALFVVIPALSAQTATGLVLVSGNGQVVNEQFLTTQPMVVQARDSAGNPVAGVAVSWAITKGSGTIVRPSTVTNANGMASANFLGTALQAGYSFTPSTITASTATSSVDFIVTTVLVRLPLGPAAPPLVELLSPALGETVSGSAGSVLPAAITVRVTAQSGAQSGMPVPNVGVFLQDAANPAAAPLGTCNGPGGTILTDAKGVATCDLVLGASTGSEQVVVAVGDYQNTRIFTLNVTPGQSCSYVLSPVSQSFGPTGGTNTLNVTTSAGCGWTAVSNANWITLGATTVGNGNGSIAYTVAANTGAARTGTITVAGKTMTVTQSAAGTANPLVLTTTSLPSGFTGAAYSVGVSATGGTPPYTWSSSGSLPPGLTFGATTGVISGVPSTAGVYQFSVTVKDSAGVSASQPLTLTVTGPGSGNGSLGILSTTFPNPVIGTVYQQGLTTSGGCVTPFSPTPVFTASGQLPPGLAIQQAATGGYSLSGTPTMAGTYTFTLSAKDACGNVATANVSLTVAASGGGGGTGTVLLANPSSLAFTVQAGGTAPSQVISLSASSGSVNFTASASSNWLSVTATGSTPATIQVTILNTQSTVTPGTYNGVVTVTPVSGGTPLQIPVTLTVQAAPALIPSPTSLDFSLQTSGASTTSQQTVSVSASGAVQFSASTVGFPWLTVTPNNATVPTTLTITANSAGLAAGIYTGAVTLTPSTGGAQIVKVNLTVTVPPAIVPSPAALVFTYRQGADQPTPQTVDLSSTAGTISFALSATSSGGSWLSAGSSSLNAPGSIAVAVNPAGLAPGSYTGTVTITPAGSAAPPVTVAVSLTVTAAPPVVSAVTNAASFAAGPVAPGEIIVVFGTGFGPATLVPASVAASGLLDTTLGQTRVLFDGVAAPMIYAVSGQVSAIVPYWVSAKSSTSLQVEYNGTLSAAVSLQIAATSPALFTLDSSGQGAIVNQDTSVNGPQNGAAPGSIVSLYATGAGGMSPSVPDGSITSADLLPKPSGNVSVTIGGLPATVFYAGAAPGAPSGLLQVNVQIPDNVPRGQSVPVFLTVGQASSTAVVTVAIAP